MMHDSFSAHCLHTDFFFFFFFALSQQENLTWEEGDRVEEYST